MEKEEEKVTFNDEEEIEEGEGEGEEEIPDKKRLYVSNLNYKTRWQKLKDYFSEIGNVAYANVFMSYNRRSKGCGVVEFEKEEDAITAIKKYNETEFDGRKIYVQFDRKPRGNEGNGRREGGNFKREGNFNRNFRREETENNSSGKCLYIGNLSFDTKEDELREELEKHGKVVDCFIPKNYNERSKGYGLAEFETEKDAKKAIEQLDRKTFQGRTIIVRLDKLK